MTNMTDVLPSLYKYIRSPCRLKSNACQGKCPKISSVLLICLEKVCAENNCPAL